MAVQANTYLVITDGTTTVTFEDGSGTYSNYRIDAWSPAVAKLRQSQIGGRGPYEDVVETMTVQVNGSTMATAYTNLQKIYTLLDQATRWYNGENQTAVLIKYAPKGSETASTASPYQAAILGWDGGQNNAIELPNDFGGAVENRTKFIHNVTFSFVRRGQWLHTETSASSSATTNGDLASITIAATTNLSPTRLSLTNFGFGNSSGPAFRQSLVAVSQDSEGIQIINGESYLGGTDYSSVADSGSNARNTNVLRLTPTATTERVSGLATLSVSAIKDRRWSVYANIRNNSTTTSFLMRVRLYSTYVTYTPYYYIAPQATAWPTWRYIGDVTTRGAVGTSFIYLTASAASGSVDIDTLVFIDNNDITTGVVEIGEEINNSSSSGQTLNVNHYLLSYPQYRVDVGSTPSTAFPIASFGDKTINTNGGTLYCLLMGTGRTTGSVGNDWRQYNVAGATVFSNTWTAYRYAAYLTPV